jgi:hypothetical protein
MHFVYLNLGSVAMGFNNSHFLRWSLPLLISLSLVFSALSQADDSLPAEVTELRAAWGHFMSRCPVGR